MIYRNMKNNFMRKALGRLSILLGVIIIVAGVVIWVKSGMPLNNIMPAKNLFGTNSLHAVLLGLVLLAYGLFEEIINKK